MHKEILELVNQVLAENDPQKLVRLLKLLRKRLADEQVRIQALIDKNTTMRKRLEQGT